jgi:hypothetical protein
MIRPLVAASIALLATLAVVRCATNPAALPSATPGEYCAAVTSYAVACHLTDPCSTATIADCPALAAGYTPAARGALTTCLDGITCGNAGSEAGAYCAEYWLAFVTPSDAQAKLAADYCRACPSPPAPTTGVTCASAFYATIDDAGAEDGGAVIIPGVGFPLLPRSDTVATTADTNCVPKVADAGAAACLAFVACALQTLSALTPPLPSACPLDAAPAPPSDASTGTDAATPDDASTGNAG